MTDGPDWQLLAKVVKERRTALRLSHYGVRDAGGPSHATVSKIEKGEATAISSETKNRLEKAFGWTHGSVDRVLAGEEPDSANLDNSGPRVEVLEEKDGERLLIDIVQGVGELSDERRREILALIRAMQDRDTPE